MREHRDIEQAFLRMRACAGNSDVREMVTKFLSREQTYASLIKNVGNLESRYETLQAETAAKNEKLHQLAIENDNRKATGYVDPLAADRAIAYEQTQREMDNRAEAEYKMLSIELEQIHAHLDHLQARKKQI